jgi:hypothetical protein
MQADQMWLYLMKRCIDNSDIDIVIVKDSLPPRLSNIKGIRSLFYRILDVLRYRGIVPHGDFRSTGVQMILQAKCPIVKLKTLQGDLRLNDLVQ